MDRNKVNHEGLFNLEQPFVKVLEAKNACFIISGFCFIVVVLFVTSLIKVDLKPFTKGSCKEK